MKRISLLLLFFSSSATARKRRFDEEESEETLMEEIKESNLTGFRNLSGLVFTTTYTRAKRTDEVKARF